jgi:hypothetical protein
MTLRAANGYAKSEAMPTDEVLPKPGANGPKSERPNNNAPADKSPLTPAAERALAEAAARRAAREPNEPKGPKEISGRDGPEPTRYGDWEINGLASDF